MVEFNVLDEGEPVTVEIPEAASIADAVGQALRNRGGVARVLRYPKGGEAGPFDAGMARDYPMGVMDIRCFLVKEDE